MFFSKPSPDNKKTGQPSQTRGLMRLFFNPELGRSTGQINTTFQMFVQMLAVLFLSSGMLDRTHRFFQPNAHYTLTDLFNETYARFDWRDKTKIPQSIFFVATWGLLISSILWLVVLVLSFIAGASPAHAEGFFEAPADDKVGNVIDELIIGNQLSGVLGGPTTGLLQEILRGMLGFYSKAMLVFASLMLLYHVINIVITSAWSGKPLDGADQIWAPLRLVLAIGLLVPLSSGLNSAQYGVLQVAKIGSGLASNVWARAASVIAQPQGGDLPYTPSVRMAQMVHDMTMIRLCQTQMNEDTLYVSGGDGNILTGTGAEMVRGFPNWLGQENKQQIKYGAGSNQTLCGSISWPVTNVTNAGVATGAAPIGTEAIAAARTTILQKIDQNFRNVDTAVCAFANTVFANRWGPARGVTPPTKLVDDMYGNPGWNSTYLFNSMSDARARNKCGHYDSVAAAAAKVKEAVQQYDTEVKAAANDAYHKIMGKIADDLANNSDPLGWMAAGSRYMRIALAQKQIHDIADASPTIQLGNIFTQEVNDEQVKKGDNSDGIPRNQKRFLQSVRGLDSASGVTSNTNYSGSIIAALQAAYGLDQEGAQEIKGAMADLPALQARDYRPQTSIVSQGGGLSGPLGLVADGLTAMLSVDRDTFTKLIVPDMADPLPNLFAFGHALYWIAIGIMLLGMTPFVGVAFTLGPIILPLAIGLAFFLPLLPMIRFFSATLAWLMAVLEAIVGMPLFALAHLSPKGQGIMGSAESGYQMLFSIALRPVLLVFGLICSMIMLSVGMFLLNHMYQAALGVIWGEGRVFVITSIILAGIYAVNAMAVCNGCFKVIDEVADKSLQWGNIRGYSFGKIGGDIDEAALRGYIGDGINMAKGAVSAARGGGEALMKATAQKKLENDDADSQGQIGGRGGSPKGNKQIGKGDPNGSTGGGDDPDSGGPGGRPKPTNFLGRQGAALGRTAGNIAGAIGSRVGGLPMGDKTLANRMDDVGDAAKAVGEGVGNRIGAIGKGLQNVKEDRDAMRGRQDRVEAAKTVGAQQRSELQGRMAREPEMRDAKDAEWASGAAGDILIGRNGQRLSEEQVQFRKQWDEANAAVKGRMEVGDDGKLRDVEGMGRDGGLAASERATIGGLGDYVKAAVKPLGAAPGKGNEEVKRKLDDDGKPKGSTPAAAPAQTNEPPTLADVQFDPIRGFTNRDDE